MHSWPSSRRTVCSPACVARPALWYRDCRADRQEATPRLAGAGQEARGLCHARRHLRCPALESVELRRASPANRSGLPF